MSKIENYNSSNIDELFQEISSDELEKTEKRMLLAVRIDEGIKAMGWKKIDFAKALNKRPSEISKWLSGTHNFNSDTLFDIEKTLGIDLINVDTKPKQQTSVYHVFVSSKTNQDKENSCFNYIEGKPLISYNLQAFK